MSLKSDYLGDVESLVFWPLELPLTALEREESLGHSSHNPHWP